MPRARKRTDTGAPAQPAQAPKGLTYGEGEAALESQRRTPLPAQPPPTPAAPGGPATSSPPAPQGPGDMEAALQAAQQMAPGASIMDAPTNRPNEALMTGLDQMGTSVQPDPALYELRALAQQYPYPDLIRFLNRAQAEA